MVSSRWQKQNSSFLYIGQAVIFGVYMAVGFFVQSLGLERNWITLLIYALVTLIAMILAFALMKVGAKSMIRVLKMENEAALFGLRMMLKNQNIQYQRQTEEELTLFDFPGQSLTMTVRPYFLHNLVLNYEKNPQPATLVTLRELNAKNKAFADTLVAAIDEMARQQPNSWKNA